MSVASGAGLLRTGQRRWQRANTATSLASVERPFSPQGDAIMNDLERTYADLPVVVRRREQIYNILRSYAEDNPDIGYVQGMNYVATIMAVKFADSESDNTAELRFTEAMVVFNGLFSDGFPLLLVGVELFTVLAERYMEELWSHLLEHGVGPMSFLPNAWLSLFGKWLPLPAVVDVADLMLEHGILGVLATTLAILEMQEARLLEARSIEDILDLINQGNRLRAVRGPTVREFALLWLPCATSLVLDGGLPEKRGGENKMVTSAAKPSLAGRETLG